MASPPTSKFSRLARLGELTSKVSGSYLGQQVIGVFQDEEKRKRALEKLHVENAVEVARALGNLKGAAMKVGQGLAQVLEGMDLPPEVSGALRRLNDKAEPIDFDIIKADIEAELEMPLHKAFAAVDPRPLGTASLAQAHVARLHDGREVVVKVLHRGIESSVDADLGALRAMFIGGRILNRDRKEVEEIFDEIRERLNEELDYYNEAKNIEFFRNALRDFPGVRIPATVPSHCTARVLTMERLQGVNLDTFLETADAAARQRAGVNLAELFFRMVHDLNALHADPHGGNYLFEPDGRIGLLDFGCVKRMDPYWTAKYARMADAVIAGDRAAAVPLFKELEVLVGDDKGAEDTIWEFSQLLAPPFRNGRYTAGGAEDVVNDRVREFGARLLKYPQIRGSRQVVFMHRSLGGTYSMLRRLQVRADWGEMAVRWHAISYAKAEGRG